MKFLVAGICAASLSACVTAPTPTIDTATYGPRPSATQAQAAALAYVQKRGFRDPQLRDVRVGMPDKLFCPFAPGFWSYGWNVVFRVNFKDSTGVYAGYVDRRAFMRRDGQIGCAARDRLGS